MPEITGFPAIIGPGAQVLVLGSMPGGESLRMGQYYAFPRNAFWEVMGAYCGAGFELPYEQRTRRIVQAGVALWDVLQFCEREGSLDSAIKRQTEVPNEIGALLAENVSIGTVLFNGKKAEKAFGRHILPGLGEALLLRLRFVSMPSTSPANARMKKAEKIKVWLEALSKASGLAQGRSICLK